MSPELLYLLKKRRSLRKWYFLKRLQHRKRKPAFSLDRFEEDDYTKLFRFKKEHLIELVDLFRIPYIFRCRNGTVCGNEEGLCIFLRRFVYPNRLFDLTKLFDRSEAELGYIADYVLNHIHDRFAGLIQDINQPWLDPQALGMLSRAIVDKGFPLPKCFGFIDGTIRPMTRPIRLQGVCYNGHRKVHSLKYQSVILPNGIIGNLFGPIEGRHHDAFLLSESGLLRGLEQLPTPNGETFYIYGDTAYPLRPQLITGYKGRVTNQQQRFNTAMCRGRIVVEWGFGKIVSLFAFVDFKKNQKLYKQPIGKMYRVAALLTNCHTCLYGSNTSTYFNMDPPRLQDYLHN